MCYLLLREEKNLGFKVAKYKDTRIKTTTGEKQKEKKQKNVSFRVATQTKGIAVRGHIYSSMRTHK